MAARDITRLRWIGRNVYQLLARAPSRVGQDGEKAIEGMGKRRNQPWCYRIAAGPALSYTARPLLARKQASAGRTIAPMV